MGQRLVTRTKSVSGSWGEAKPSIKMMARQIRYDQATAVVLCSEDCFDLRRMKIYSSPVKECL